MLAEVQMSRVLRERAAIDHFGAGFGQRPLAESRKLLVELARQHELEDSVAQELKPLIGLQRHALLVRDGRVRQRQF